jgi:hypothetical protein
MHKNKRKIIISFMTILLYLSIVSLSYAQGHHRNRDDSTHHLPVLEEITVTGTVIIDSTAATGTRYYLDTNNAGSKDYRLSFGPSSYVPASGATRPLAGAKVAIVGDIFKHVTPPVIAVLKINGLVWRDSLGTKFYHNPVDQDSLKDKHNPWGNKFGWCVKDSLTPVSLSGTAIVDSIGTNHKNYFLDLQGDGGKDYILMFGPHWYTPKSGATRPKNGDAITIEGGLIEKTDSLDNILKYVVVYKINGLVWIDSIGKFPWPGKGIGRNHSSSLKIGSIYNSNTNIQFESRCFGSGMGWNKIPDDLYASITEIDPLYLPVEYSGNVVAVYSVNIMDERMNGIFESFSKNVKVNLNYTNRELVAAGVKNSQLKLKYISENNTSVEIPSASINYTTNTISFSQVDPSGIYVIEGPNNSTLYTRTSTVIPQQMSLSQNYPNPFNPETRISFALPQSGNVKLTIYSILGSEVRTLCNDNLESGSYEFTWDGTNNLGMKVSSGIYLYKLQTTAGSITKRMNLLK